MQNVPRWNYYCVSIVLCQFVSDYLSFTALLHHSNPNFGPWQELKTGVTGVLFTSLSPTGPTEHEASSMFWLLGARAWIFLALIFWAWGIRALRLATVIILSELTPNKTAHRKGFIYKPHSFCCCTWHFFTTFVHPCGNIWQLVVFVVADFSFS